MSDEVERRKPVRAADVAAYILEQMGPMSASKLHVLLYYAQAWHLTVIGSPLFEDEIYAEASGYFDYSELGGLPGRIDDPAPIIKAV